MTTETAAFPVTWDDPADAEKTWFFNPEHMPLPYPPLEFELGPQRKLAGFGWGMVPRQFNYYVYFAFGSPANPPNPPATPDSIREGARRWREDVLPEVIRHTEHYRATDFSSMSNEELVAEIERLPEVCFRAGQLHTLAVQPHWEGMSLLIETYKELTGGNDLGAMRLAQGYPNKSVESALELWGVSRIAAEIPQVAERLRAMEREAALDALGALKKEPAATPFVAALDSYLDDYGWRGDSTLSAPSWYEDPSVPLMLIRTYLLTEGYDPIEEQRRLIDERGAAVRSAVDALDEGGSARLKDALDAATSVAPLLEDHNFYIDQRLAGMPRRLIMAAAARLPLDQPHDVFFLHKTELCAALRGEARDLLGLTMRRKEEFAHWSSIAPPAFLGVRPPEVPTGEPRPAERDGTPEELRGTAASAGVVTGPARILLSLGEAERLRPGDVLVTAVTQPTWTPLFAVARAVVTEVGGMLSHTAVASREFGIPAVVAVRDATRLLHDGQLVEVDGTRGVVRLIG